MILKYFTIAIMFYLMFSCHAFAVALPDSVAESNPESIIYKCDGKICMMDASGLNKTVIVDKKVGSLSVSKSGQIAYTMEEGSHKLPQGITHQKVNLYFKDISTKSGRKLSDDVVSQHKMSISPNGKKTAYLAYENLFIDPLSPLINPIRTFRPVINVINNLTGVKKTVVSHAKISNINKFDIDNNLLQYAGEIIWSPDSSKLLFNVRFPDEINPEDILRGTSFISDINTRHLSNIGKQGSGQDWIGDYILFNKQNDLYLYDTKLKKVVHSIGTSNKFYSPLLSSISPDGQSVVYAKERLKLMLKDLNTNKPLNIFSLDNSRSWPGDIFSQPLWSPDGRKILFDDGWNIYITDTYGTILQKTKKTSGSTAAQWTTVPIRKKHSPFVMFSDEDISFEFCGPKADSTELHQGIDIMASVDTLVYPVCDGMVEENYTTDAFLSKYDTNKKKYWNSFLIVKHNCDGEEIYGYYGHIESGLNKNDKVYSLDNGLPIPIGKIRKSYDKYGKRSPNDDHLHLGLNSGLKSGQWGYSNNSCVGLKKDGWKNVITYFKW